MPFKKREDYNRYKKEYYHKQQKKLQELKQRLHNYEILFGLYCEYEVI